MMDERQQVEKKETAPMKVAGVMLSPGHAHMVVASRTDDGLLRVVPRSAVTYRTPGGLNDDITDWHFRACVDWYLQRFGATRIAICTSPNWRGSNMRRARVILRSLAAAGAVFVKHDAMTVRFVGESGDGANHNSIGAAVYLLQRLFQE